MGLFTLLGLGCTGKITIPDDDTDHPYDTGYWSDTDTDTDTDVDTDVITDTLDFVPKKLMTSLDETSAVSSTSSTTADNTVEDYYTYETGDANLIGDRFQLVWAEFRDTYNSDSSDETVSSHLYFEGLTASDSTCYGFAERTARLFADGVEWSIGESTDAAGANDYAFCEDGSALTGAEVEEEILELLDGYYPGTSNY